MMTRHPLRGCALHRWACTLLALVVATVAASSAEECATVTSAVCTISYASPDRSANVDARIQATLDDLAEKATNETTREACLDALQLALCYSHYRLCIQTANGTTVHPAVPPCSTLRDVVFPTCQGPPFVLDEDDIAHALETDDFASCNCFEPVDLDHLPTDGSYPHPCPIAEPTTSPAPSVTPTAPPRCPPGWHGAQCDEPECTNNEYESTWSACVDGIKTLTFRVKEDVNCVDAIHLASKSYTKPCGCPAFKTIERSLASPCIQSKRILYTYFVFANESAPSSSPLDYFTLLQSDYSCDVAAQDLLSSLSAPSRVQSCSSPPTSASLQQTLLIGPIPGATLYDAPWQLRNWINVTCSTAACLWNERPEGGKFDGMRYEPFCPAHPFSDPMPTITPGEDGENHWTAVNGTVHFVRPLADSTSTAFTLTLNAPASSSFALLSLTVQTEAIYDGVTITLNDRLSFGPLYRVVNRSLMIPLTVGLNSLTVQFSKDSSRTEEDKIILESLLLSSASVQAIHHYPGPTAAPTLAPTAPPPTSAPSPSTPPAPSNESKQRLLIILSVVGTLASVTVISLSLYLYCRSRGPRIGGSSQKGAATLKHMALSWMQRPKRSRGRRRQQQRQQQQQRRRWLAWLWPTAAGNAATVDDRPINGALDTALDDDDDDIRKLLGDDDELDDVDDDDVTHDTNRFFSLLGHVDERQGFEEREHLEMQSFQVPGEAASTPGTEHVLQHHRHLSADSVEDIDLFGSEGRRPRQS